MSEPLDKLRSRGHWRVVIRPGQFLPARIKDIASLQAILQNNFVELRGWDFPHLDPHTEPHIDVDWVGQESEWEHYLEVWRFYQSGQFVDITSMSGEWRDQSGLSPPDANWRPGQFLGVGDAVSTYTEIFVFASRLALTEEWDEGVHIEVTCTGLDGRRLWVDSRNRWPMRRIYEATIQELPYKVDLLRTALVAEPWELALEPARELFQRFGWNPTMDMLRSLQGELRRWPR